MTEIEQLNQRIGGEYRSIEGRALFRLIWSESIFENRYGTFREFTEGGIFIREVTEVRRVRKYNYIHNRWIFEAWAPGNLTKNPETPDTANGDYVPVYVFEDKNGQYLPPNEKVVRFIISAMHGKIRKDYIPSQEYIDEREIQRDVESMDDHPAWFQTRSGPGRNAIWYPGLTPEWHHRRSTIDNTAIEKAGVFRDELQELEDLQKKKAALRSEIKEKEQAKTIESVVESPMHKRSS